MPLQTNNKFNLSIERSTRENIIMDYYNKIHNSKKDTYDRRQEVVRKLTQTKRDKNRSRTRKMKKVTEENEKELKHVATGGGNNTPENLNNGDDSINNDGISFSHKTLNKTLKNKYISGDKRLFNTDDNDDLF